MSTPHQPEHQNHTTGAPSTPDFWQTATPQTSAADLPPVEASAPERHRSGGRGYGITALVIAACSLLLGVVTPHFAAILVAGGGVTAAIGMRKCAGPARKFSLVGLITSVIVFVLCIIYTIVTYVIMAPALYEQM